MPNTRQNPPPPRRTNDREEDSYSDQRASRWRIIKGISVEGILALLTSAATLVYAFAVLTARVDQNTRDTARVDEWIKRHEDADREHSTQLDTRLQGIEQRLDILIGRLDAADTLARRKNGS